MKSKILAIAMLAATAACGNANKTNESDMKNNETDSRTTLTAQTVDLGKTFGEEKTIGKVEIYNLDGFRLHVYYTQDVMNDASYIVEGTDSLVTMEEPLFKVNVSEFNRYLEKVGKPMAARITDYHLGGTGDHEVTMAEGMPAFMKGPVYGGMMEGLRQAFGDTMTDLPTGKEDEVAFGTTVNYAGVPFEFRRGAASDFPGASILIGEQVYYTHWTPVKAHMSHLQLSSRAAVDAELSSASDELNSGAVLYIGGHGGATQKEAVEFKIKYLTTVREILAKAATPDDFVAAMKKAYPGLPGEDGLEALAQALYK